MKTNFLNKFGRILMGSVIAISLVSCNKNDDDAPAMEMDVEAAEYFSVIYSSSTTGNTGTYIQAFTNPFTGVVNFNGFGYEVPSTRTARLYASTDGKSIYNLDYGGGTVTQFDVIGGQNYTRNEQLNVALKMGTEYPRGTKVSDENMLIHTVNTERMYTTPVAPDTAVYTHTQAVARIGVVDLSTMSFVEDADEDEYVKDVLLTPSAEDMARGMYISRIDAPAIVGGKAYYGYSMSWRNEKGDRPDGSSTPAYQSQSLVVDFPSLENPKIITSTVSQGSTYGYRIPVAHVDEKGDIYQISRTHMLKITNGEYDNTYNFDLKAAAGVNAQGWFYAGNGIGYATTFDPAIGSSSKLKAWGVTRVDIYNKTAIDMNVVGDLSLGQYQMAKVGKDGKVYMALAPVGKGGNVYIFDPAKADANGFTLGAELVNTGVDNSYIGIF